jgi:anthranilate phosphoribosyltransferase
LHPFAQYIQALGRGKNGTRDLTEVEAEQAMSMILDGRTTPEQLGAFLMLMRVKEETPAEISGFVRALRASVTLPESFPSVDLDWAAYAGKRRQLPWFILSALLLASQGIKVLMHGAQLQVAGRMNTPDALNTLGIDVSASFMQVTEHLSQRNFAFMPLEVINPELQRLLALKQTLGLRSPLHSVVKMLNPAGAPASLVGIFHPSYDDKHQAAAQMLGDGNLAVFKGEGGESERNPDTACQVKMLMNGNMTTEIWPAVFEHRHLKDKGCAVRTAAENGDISLQRYQRYLKLREKMPTAK